MDFFELAEQIEDISIELKEVDISFQQKDNNVIIKLPPVMIKLPSYSCDYSYFTDYSFVIKGNDDSSFSCKVVANGYYIENLDIRKIYEDKDFSKEELLSFIKEFPKLHNNITISSAMNIDEFKDKVMFESMKLEGINKTYYSSYDDTYGIDKKNIHEIDIAYFSDNNNFYRVELYSTFGMSSSGDSTASWGNININKINELPSEFTYIPKEELKLIFKTNESEIISFPLETISGKFLNDFIFYDEYGKKEYCPSGKACIGINEKNLNTYFSKGTYIIDIEEVVPLEDIKFEEVDDEINWGLK